ncbi:MAG: 50S ribosomal protein L10 [Clostridia bacterium]|nr:50S ribosomal protein L10 [Clostridia bacterium]
MSEARKQKELEVAAIKEKISNCKSFVIVDYKGISVAQDTTLRALFRKANVEYKVLKNRLVAIALDQLGFGDKFNKDLEGSTAVAFANEDAVSAAKILKDNGKEYPQIKVKCGMVDGTYIDAKGVEALASLPSKEALLGMLAGVLQAPISGLARALNATIGGLAIALKAVADQKA